MPRSTVRIIAVIVLALLGAPVAMHVVMHDLHDHRDAHADAAMLDTGHDDHEHPMIGSAAPPMPGHTSAALPVVRTPAMLPTTWSRTATVERNALSHGSLRMDDDVGLQPLLSTFLI